MQAASNIINPMQLPAFLIKPVQRLCRYPMLLGSLLKLTPPSHVLYASLVEGVGAVKRIADGANRALREKENAETWEHTLSRIRDWKGLPLDNTGPLLLDDLFSVFGERRPYSEYHIFLFDRMLLLCRPKEMQPEAETTDKEKKGDGKLTPSFKRSQAISFAVLPPTPNNGNPSSFFLAGAVASRRSKTPLSVRGSIYIRSILEITPETSGLSISQFF
jgi:cell division control protein 24